MLWINYHSFSTLNLIPPRKVFLRTEKKRSFSGTVSSDFRSRNLLTIWTTANLRDCIAYRCPKFSKVVITRFLSNLTYAAPRPLSKPKEAELVEFVRLEEIVWVKLIRILEAVLLSRIYINMHSFWYHEICSWYFVVFAALSWYSLIDKDNLNRRETYTPSYPSWNISSWTRESHAL